jgi:hypothetical protein
MNSKEEIRYAIKRGEFYSCGENATDLTPDLCSATLYNSIREANRDVLHNYSEKVVKICVQTTYTDMTK